MVVIVGGNDGQDLIAPKGTKIGRVFWKGDEWKEPIGFASTRFLSHADEERASVFGSSSR